VIFLSTTGELPLPDREGFLNWLKSGKGFVGIHAATDTLYGWPGYLELIGAYFLRHGPQVEVEVINQDPKFPATRDLPGTWKVYDEIYQFKKFDRSKVHGLLTLDKHPNDKTPGDYPVAWCKEYGDAKPAFATHGGEWMIQKKRKVGRIFYTSLGHREDVWDPKWEQGGRKNPPEVVEAYQKHILAGIKWALGLEKGDATPQTATIK
jgi:type 1 glutamine amidotransferase